MLQRLNKSTISFLSVVLTILLFTVGGSFWGPFVAVQVVWFLLELYDYWNRK